MVGVDISKKQSDISSSIFLLDVFEIINQVKY